MKLVFLLGLEHAQCPWRIMLLNSNDYQLNMLQVQFFKGLLVYQILFTEGELGAFS